MATKHRCDVALFARISQRTPGAIVLLILLLSVAGSVTAQQYVQITAKIELIDYIAKTNQSIPVEKRRSYSATVIVGTNEWRIDHDFTPNWHGSWYYDGTNVFQRLRFAGGLTQLSNVLDANSLSFPNAASELYSNITIWINSSPGGHPLGELAVNIPWLAFCSGTYLKRPKRDIPLPTIIIRYEPGAFAYDDQTEVFEDDFGLPKTVQLFTSKVRYAASLYDERLIRDPRVLAARSRPVLGFPDKALKFRYDVTATTNVSGWTFPTEFSYTTYKFDRQGESHPFVGGEGTALSFRITTKPENIFMPERVQKVVDYRFRHQERLVDGIIYAATNLNAAPSTNEVALRDKFAGLVERAPIERRAPGAQRFVRFIVFLVCIAVTVALISVLSRKRTTQQQSNVR